MNSLRQDLAAHPEVVAAIQTLADTVVKAGEEILTTAATDALPGPVSAIAQLFMPALQSLEARLTAKMDAAIQSLAQAPVVTTPGSGVAGLVELEEIDTPAAKPAAAAAPPAPYTPAAPDDTLSRKQAARAATGPVKPATQGGTA